MKHPFHSPTIAAKFATFAPPHAAALLTLRDLIFDTAATLPVGKIEETLKWGQPSYTTPDIKAATPIRLSVTKQGDIALLTHCQSKAITNFRAIAPPDLRFDGNRALLLDAAASLPLGDITPLIRAALTYHL